MLPAPTAAVLDANVLYPMTLRDTLLRVAEAGLYRPHWSATILDEMEHNLIGNEVLTAGQAARLRQVMTEAFDDAAVVGFEHHIPALRNDAKDRHVVAAALEVEVSLIVTENLRDFTPLPPGLEACSPEAFLVRLFDRHPRELIRVLTEQAAAYENPPYSLEELLVQLVKTTPGLVAVVRNRLGQPPIHALEVE